MAKTLVKYGLSFFKNRKFRYMIEAAQNRRSHNQKMISISVVNYSDYQIHLNHIRSRVFQQEQNVPEELEFDGYDSDAQHLLAYLDGIPVGTTRIRFLDAQTAKIERLAVLPEARGRGIATLLMQKALSLCKSQQQVIVNAQIYIQHLYEKLGFQVVGEPFNEAGIAHVKMIFFV